MKECWRRGVQQIDSTLFRSEEDDIFIPLPVQQRALAEESVEHCTLFAEAFRIPHEIRKEAWAQFPTTFNLTFFWPGPLFPLSLLILGAMLVRTRSIPLWAGILICLAAVAFPLSRIPRINLVAHAADILTLVPLAYIGSGFLKSRPRV